MSSPVASSSATAAKVLIVEDNPSFQWILEQKLTIHGLRPVVCADGAAALERMRQERFDLILLDIHLPKATGIDVLKQRATTLNADAPILVLSAVYEPEVIHLTRTLGANGYLIKGELSLAQVVQAIDAELATSDT
jgi:CheY-like chemotaxis protein